MKPATAEQPSCIHVSDAIRAQGIEDLTSLASVQFAFTIVYSCLFAVGLIGNGGVLLAVGKNKRLWSARNIFLLNLIVTDLLLCLTSTPVTPLYALLKEWKLGSLMCHAMPLSNSCAVFVTSWSLCAIAMDKFLHIVDPTREQFSVRFASGITVLIWLICSVINIPYLLSYELVDGSYYVPKNSTPFCGRFCDEINWSGETERRLYGSTVMLLQFVVPMAIITHCYWRILAKVRRDMIIQNAQFSQSLSISQRMEAINRKKRVNYILIAMVLAFIGCWLPITAVNLLKDFKSEPEFVRTQPYLWPLIAHVIAMSTIIWNPILFFWLTRKQKRPNLGRILHTGSEVLASALTTRVNSLHGSRRSHLGDLRTGSETRPKRCSQQLSTDLTNPIRKKFNASGSKYSYGRSQHTTTATGTSSHVGNGNAHLTTATTPPATTVRPLILIDSYAENEPSGEKEGSSGQYVQDEGSSTESKHCLLRESTSIMNTSAG